MCVCVYVWGEEKRREGREEGTEQSRKGEVEVTLYSPKIISISDGGYIILKSSLSFIVIHYLQKYNIETYKEIKSTTS